MSVFTPTITAAQILAALNDDSIKITGSTTKPVFYFDAHEQHADKVAGGLTLAQVADTNFTRGYKVYASAGPDVSSKWGIGHVYIPVTGTYTAGGLFEKAAGNGIITVYLNGTSKGTIDLYAAGTTYDNFLTTTLGSLTAGLYAVELGTQSKNGASGGYQFGYSTFWIYKTI